ncbi:thioredoxin b [Amia ocellicauda]|uniref:thioredoxin b n=1 Tax=Amia ocellicauda TaxID=2972642 RepID=UPI0034639D73|nr:THIO protein [Amia calva]
MLIEIEDKDAFDKALKDAGDKLVVVDFTATWCGPCQAVGPHFKRFSEEYQDVVFLKVDVDEAQDVAAACDIKCMPTFHFYKNAKQIDHFSGANADMLEKKIKENK